LSQDRNPETAILCARVDEKREDGSVGVRLDLEQARSDNVVFGLSPLAELGAALHVLAEPEHHLVEAEWVANTRAVIEPKLARRCVELSALWGSYRLRLLFPPVTSAVEILRRRAERDLDACSGQLRRADRFRGSRRQLW